MARQDTTDFLAAFAVGTVLGIGATLLLRPEPRTAKDRLMRELKPYGKRMRRNAARVAREVRGAAAATDDLSEDAIDAGRELLAEFRDEVARILEEARDELVEAARARAREQRRKSRDERGKGRGEGAARGTRGRKAAAEEVEVEVDEKAPPAGRRGWLGRRGRPDAEEKE